METYCENPFCQNRAVVEVPVSVERPSDRVVALCALCEEVYTWGVQHCRAQTTGQSQIERASTLSEG